MFGIFSIPGIRSNEKQTRFLNRFLGSVCLKFDNVCFSIYYFLAILLDNNLSIWNIRLIIAYSRPGIPED